MVDPWHLFKEKLLPTVLTRKLIALYHSKESEPGEFWKSRLSSDLGFKQLVALMIFMPSFTACKQDLNQRIQARFNYCCCCWWQWIQNSSGTNTIICFDLWGKASQRIWPCYFYIIPYQVHELSMTLICDWAMSASFRKASNLDFRFQVVIELQHPGELTLMCLKKKKKVFPTLNKMSFSFQSGVLHVLSARLRIPLTALLWSRLRKCERKWLAFFLGKNLNEL